MEFDGAAVALLGVGGDGAAAGDVLAQQGDGAAVAVGVGGGGTDGAAVDDVGTAGEVEGAVGIGDDAGGLGDIAGVDGSGEDVLGLAGGEEDASTAGVDLAAVEDGGVDAEFVLQDVLGHTDADEALAVEGEDGLFTGGHIDGAEVGADDALVLHLFAQQGDVTAGGGVDKAGVDDGAIGTEDFAEDVVAVHEVVGGDVEAGGNQSTDIDAGGTTKEEAVGVNEDDGAVGVDLAVDLRGVVAEDAIEGEGVATGLVVVDDFVAGEVVAAPVDGHGVALLDDVGHHAGLGDGAGATDDGAAGG